MKDKNILIIANNDVGLYRFRKNLIEELLKENKVTVALPYGEKVEDLKAIGCEFIDTPLDRRGLNPFVDYLLCMRYKTILNDIHPDLVLTYTIKPNIYGGVACRKAIVPYAVNITGLGTAFQKDGLLKKTVIHMYRFALKKAKVVFFENTENQQIFVKEKIVVENKTKILNGAGVDLDEFKLLPYPKDSKSVKFLFIGRVMAEKGIDELLGAMKCLRADGIECHLDVVGWCEEAYEDLLNQCQAEGWLTYHGFQTDVRPFIESCHCFVLPSWHEGMANTNLECAASGRPVITSNIHGCLEAVEDGVSGYLAEKQNEESLCEVMKRFCQMAQVERKAMGLAGRKRMEEIFDKKKVVAETVAELMK